MLAQQPKDSTSIAFNLNFNEKPFELHTNYISTNQDTLKIDLLKFYISNIVIHYSDHSKYEQANSYHLIDASNSKSLQIPLCKNTAKPISKITFAIGVDSLKSVSGALDGALDPSNAMYWAWQSGYINMKIEGKSNSCKTRNNQFHFHIGGYLTPFNALRKKEIQLITDSGTIVVNIDLGILFSKIQLSKTNSIMIPGIRAMELADLGSTMFVAGKNEL